MARWAVRGNELVDLDEHPELDRPKRAPLPKRPKAAPPEVRCGRTKTSWRPATLEEFINQCIKERNHSGPHSYETV
jgi:hypothetical protein